MNITKSFPRYTTNLNNAASAYATDVFSLQDWGVISVSARTNQTLLVTFLWGRDSDAANALPHGDQQSFASGSGEGGGNSYVWPIPPDATKGRILLTNSSGSNITALMVDVGLREI